MVLKDLMVLLKKEKRKTTLVQKVVVGIGALIAVGVTTIILFAPKSGKLARGKIVKNAQEIQKDIKNSGRDIKKEIQKTTKNVSKEIKKLL